MRSVRKRSRQTLRGTAVAVAACRELLAEADSLGLRYGLLMVVRAQVRKGRLVLDELTDLPEGSEVTLELVEDVLSAEFSPDERARLEASIERARAQAIRGEGIDGEEYIAALRTSRR